MYNMKLRYRKSFSSVVELVKEKDKMYYINYLCDMLNLDKDEKKEFKKSYKIELLKEVEYNFFIDFLKNKNKIIIKL